jgi:hypothetical protein
LLLSGLKSLPFKAAWAVATRLQALFPGHVWLEATPRLAGDDVLRWRRL